MHHKTTTYVIDTINCTVPKKVATCFDQLYDHRQATGAHKTKITGLRCGSAVTAGSNPAVYG